MEVIINLRNIIARVYSNYEFFFRLAVKFAFVLITLNYLTDNLGYYEALNILSVRLFISVICAFIPVPFVVFIMGIVALLHLYRLSMIIAILAAIVYVIVYFLYVKFAPSQGIFMLAIAVLTPFNFQYIVVFILGMFYAPVTLILAALTIGLMRFTGYSVDAAAAMGTGFNMERILTEYQSIIDHMMADRTLVVVSATMAIIIVFTYIISKLPFDYSWYVAIGIAAIAGIVVFYVGKGMFDVDADTAKTVLAIILGAIIAACLQFFKCVIDYPKKEFVQFEDDDYYYYVRAIPKMGAKLEYIEEDDTHAPEELDDKQAALKKKARKKAAKAKKREEQINSFSAQETEVDSHVSSGQMDSEQTMQERSDSDDFSFNEGAFDDYDFFEDDQSKF